MTLALLLAASLGLAAPADLDALVDLALERDPEAAALLLDAEAARARARGARNPMDPELMVGVESLGASMESPDPTMFMVGASQMLRGPGEGRASAEIASLGAARAEADRRRVAADLRVRLWQAAARLRALQAEIALTDEQLRAAAALLEVGRARFGAGAAPVGMGGGMPGMGSMGGMSGMDAMETAPPAVSPRDSGGMPGMGGMGGMGGGGGASPGVPVPSTMAPSGSSLSGGATGGMSGASGGLADLLRLDAAVARLEAERAALDADVVGELAVLEAFVGAEAAGAVAAAPVGFLGAAPGGTVPERDLARLDAERAGASLRAAELARRPDLMVSGTLNLMPDGMPESADLSLGLEVPLWGGRGREIDAAKAELSAAEARADRVERDLAVARARARAAWTSALRRAEALEQSATPRSRAAWDAAQRLYAAGQGDAQGALLAWQSWIEVSREAVVARRDAELRAAELARLEEP